MTCHVLTAEFIQESNAFVTGFAGLEDFAATCLAEGPEAIEIRGAANAELAGFLEVGPQAGWKITP